jgi:hypothetical protein
VINTQEFNKLEVTKFNAVSKNHTISVACFLLGNSSASEFYMPTFWNTLSVPS